MRGHRSSPILLREPIIPTVGDNECIANDAYVIYITGWWYTYPSEKYEFVSWDDDTPIQYGKHKIHVPNHQPD